LACCAGGRVVSKDICVTHLCAGHSVVVHVCTVDDDVTRPNVLAVATVICAVFSKSTVNTSPVDLGR
jgi:hypothetical protein